MTKLFSLSAVLFIAISTLPARLLAEDFVRLSARSAQVADRCSRAADYTGWNMIRCAYAEEVRQQRLMERAYRVALSRVRPRGRHALIAAQTAWQSSVDRRCRKQELYSPAPIGTIAMLEGHGCLGGAYADRIPRLARRPRR